MERQGRSALWWRVALVAVFLAGCAAPAAAAPSLPPEPVLQSLRAAERGDVSGFLEGFAFAEAAEGVAFRDPAGERYAYEAVYRVWLQDAAEIGALSWHVVRVQRLPDGGQLVVVDMVASLDEGDERFSLEFSTNKDGKIVTWTIARELAGP